MPYPEGYRAWTHVRSAVILPGHPLEASFGGVHHDLLAADSKDNAIGEGARKFIGVMHRNAQRYAATGGWGYEAFALV